MQAIILAGGLATRLRPLTETVPKSMIPVCGEPFLKYQIDLLRKSGIRDIVLCVGHLSETICNYFGDGSQFDVKIRYSQERQRPLGTGGALRQALPLLHDHFLVMYGDSYLMIDYADLAQKFLASRMPGMMVVYRNEDRWDRSNAMVRDGKVVSYSKVERMPGTVYIDAGVTAFQRATVQQLRKGRGIGLQALLGDLACRGLLAAYESQQRFYEIGSFSGLKEFETLMLSAHGNTVGIPQRHST